MLKKAFFVMAVAVISSQAISDPTQTITMDSEGTSKESAQSDTNTDAADKAAAMEFAKRNGYRLVTRNGDTLFCRKETLTGSRVRAQDRCFTRQQLQRMSDAAQQTLMEQTGRMTQPREGT